MLPEQSKCNTFEQTDSLYNISYVALHVLSSQKNVQPYYFFLRHEYTISMKWLDNAIHKTQLI